MIVECAGLPGCGKTTICRQVALRTAGKGSVPLSSLRVDNAFRRAAMSIVRLVLSARPLRFDRLRRGCNLLAFLRHFQHRERMILLDQGLAQKLWSLLADAEVFSEIELARALEALESYGPDLLVWVETPVDLAVRRIGSRQHGNSRYDGLPSQDAERLLRRRAPLLRRIVRGLMKDGSAIDLNGVAPPEDNARRIEVAITALQQKA